MTIQCGSCGEASWCIWDDGDWTCKSCYLEQGYDLDSWNAANEDAKQRRQEKRNNQAQEEYSDYGPSDRSSSYTPKPRLCKYGCGMALLWDATLQTKNKFIEVETQRPHSFMRCGDLLKKQGKKLVK